MKFSTQNLQEIRQVLRIGDYISRYVPLRPSGSQLKGRCPFHEEKTPSFFVYPDRDSYVCFGCGAKGDLFDFIMRYEGISFGDAVKKCAVEANVTLEWEDSEKEAGFKKDHERKQHLYNINEQVCQFFEKQLERPVGKTAREYLEQRGISMETARMFRLGYACDEWDMLTEEMHRRSWLNDGVELGLLKKKEETGRYYDFFRHRLTFPVIDTSGRVCAFSTRILDSTRPEGKYVNSPESIIYSKRLSLFGINLARQVIVRDGQIPIVVEGNLDVVSMHQAGLKSTVAPLGTAFTEDQLKILHRFSRDIIIMFDGDHAGINAALKTIPLLARMRMGGRTVILPEGEDPDSMILSGKYAELIEIIGKSQPHIETFLSRTLVSREKPVSDRIASLTGLAPLWEVLPSEIADVYLEQISLMLDVDLRVIRTYLNKHTKSEELKNNIPKTEKLAIKSLSVEERSELIALMHLFALYLRDHKLELPTPDPILYEDLVMGNLARDLLRAFIEEGLPKPDNWAVFFGEALLNEFKMAIESIPETADIKQIYSEILSNIKKTSLKRQIKLMDYQIMEAKKESDTEKLSSLLNKKLNLERQRIKTE